MAHHFERAALSSTDNFDSDISVKLGMSEEKTDHSVITQGADDLIAVLVDEGLPRKGVVMVVDHATALDFVRKNVVGKPLTTKLIGEVNELAMQHADDGPEWCATGLDDDHIFRRSTIHVRGSPVVHPYPHELPAVVDKLIQTFESAKEAEVDPVAAAILFHFCFLYVHPFKDGNGRTSRLLLNAMLHDAGLFGCVIREQDRPLYMSFFADFFDDGSADALHTFFLQRCYEHTSMILDYHS
jgi:Fic family protein